MSTNRTLFALSAFLPLALASMACANDVASAEGAKSDGPSETSPANGGGGNGNGNGTGTGGTGTGGEEERPSSPQCPGRDIVAPVGAAVYARLDRTLQRVAYSVSRQVQNASSFEIVYDIYDEPTCGGTPRLLAENVRSLSFAFDEQNRLVYFARVFAGAIYAPQVVVRTGDGTSEPFLGGCIVGNEQHLFLDVSKDGKRALVSRELSSGYEMLHWLGTNGSDGCGKTFSSSDDGPFDGTWNRFFTATRLSWDGKTTLRAPQGDNDCTIGEGNRSNDLRTYDIGKQQNARTRAPEECLTMEALAWLPDNQRFLVYLGGAISVATVGSDAEPVKIWNTFQNHVWLDVSVDGSWLAIGSHIEPMPKLP